RQRRRTSPPGRSRSSLPAYGQQPLDSGWSYACLAMVRDGTAEPNFAVLWRCVLYALAQTHGLPLLFKGTDFAQTDIISALSRADRKRNASGLCGNTWRDPLRLSRPENLAGAGDAAPFGRP